jgi:hypothetical protein
MKYIANSWEHMANKFKFIGNILQYIHIGLAIFYQHRDKLNSLLCHFINGKFNMESCILSKIKETNIYTDAILICINVKSKSTLSATW